MAHAPTIIVSTDADPAPRAEVVFPTLPAGTAKLRQITRLADGREYAVRDSLGIVVVGAAQRLDHEVPFGIPVTWRAEALNSSDVSLGFTDASAPVTVDVEDTWVHNPLDPTTAVRCTLLRDTSREWSRPVPGTVHYPINRRVGVVIAGPRQGIQGQRFSILVADEDVDRFADIIGGYSTTRVPVLCFRVGASTKMRLPRPLFGAVLDMREIDVDLSQGGDSVAFTMTADEVDPPTPALVVPLLTRADVNAYYATRAAFNADNLTRLAANRRYDLAGTA